MTDKVDFLAQTIVRVADAVARGVDSERTATKGSIILSHQDSVRIAASVLVQAFRDVLPKAAERLVPSGDDALPSAYEVKGILKLMAEEVLATILDENGNCPICLTDKIEGQPHEHEFDCIVGRYEAARREAAEERSQWRKDQTDTMLNELVAKLPDAPSPPAPDELVQRAVDRFLCWSLPPTFSPDCGISFDGRKPDARGYPGQWPVGTNLFTATEADAMVRHILGDIIEALCAERDAAVEKSDAEMLRVKACEHIACGDEGWERLRNECPSTAAVSRLRDRVELLERETIDAALRAWPETGDVGAEPGRLIDELAAERDKAEARVKALEGAMQDVIATDHHNLSDGPPPRYVTIARQALAAGGGNG